MTLPASLSAEEVALVVLVHAFVFPLAVVNDDNGQTVPPGKVQKQLAIFLLRLLRDETTAVYPTFGILCQRLVDGLGVVIGTAVVQQLQEVLQNLTSPHDLIRMFQDFGELVPKQKSITAMALQQADGPMRYLDPRSPLGLFMRRCRATFYLMPFEATVRLYLDIQATVAAVVAGVPEVASRPSLRDAAAVEAFFNYQLQKADELGLSHRCVEVEAALDELCEAGCSGFEQGAPRALFVRLMCAIHRRDYPAAIENAHRYFDYTFTKAAVDASHQPAGSSDSSSGAKGQFQNALLSLSATHTAFGHTQEAMQALNETLRMAQQSNDDWCLLHALATLCRTLASAAPGAPGLPDDDLAAIKHGTHHVQLLRLLARCQKRGRELQAPHITAFATVELARFAMQRRVETSDTGVRVPGGGGGGSAGVAVDLKVSQSDDAADDAGGQSGTPQPMAAQLQVRQALRDTCLMHHQSVVAAANPTSALASCAMPAIAASAAAIAAIHAANARAAVGELYSGPATFSTTSKASASASAASVKQLAGSAHLLLSAAWSQSGNTALRHVHSLVQLACYSSSGRAEETELAYAQLIDVTRHKHGLSAAATAEALATCRFPLCTATEALSAVRMGLEHDRALARGDLPRAELAVAGLRALAGPSEHLGMDVRMEAQRRAVLSLISGGSLPEAHHLATDLFARCAQAGMQTDAMRSLLLSADVHWAADNLLGALPYVLSCLQHATQLSHDPLAAEAAVLLARTWRGMSPGHLPELLKIVEEALPVLHAHGSVEARARSQLAVAEMILECAEAPPQLAQHYPWLVQLLRGAAEGYKLLEQYEAAARAQYLLAVLHDSQQNVSARDAVAQALLGAQCGAGGGATGRTPERP